MLKGHKSIGPKYYKNRLRLAGVSFALDGVAEDRSAWLTQPYQLPPPGKRSAYSGYPWASDEAATDLFTRAAAGGWPVAVEANGDAAYGQLAPHTAREIREGADDGGEIVEHGPVLDVIDSPKEPYTAKLLSAIPTFGEPMFQ